MRGRALTTLTASVAIMCLGATATAQARSFDLPSQPLAVSLRAIGSQTDTNVLFDPPLVAGRNAPALKGELSTDQALRTLLSGTGITYEFLNERTIVLASATPRSHSASTSQEGPGSQGSPDSRLDDSTNNSHDDRGVQSKGFWDRFRLARVDQGTPAVGAARSASANSPNPTVAHSPDEPIELEEVMVTAEKREERLQDVPVAVSALDANSLIERNQVRLGDYFSSIPGLSLTSGLHGEPVIAIRGITTDPYTNPTVGITVDDVPFGASTGLAGGNAAPDLDPSDLSRIEVLRGPQGTLYGASSLGGLLKYVTVAPSTDGLSGHLQAEVNGVHNGNDPGYAIRGGVNMPLGDTVALLGSGFYRQDPGYVNDVLTGARGVNWADVYGGRLSALWRPSEDFSLKLSAFFQNNKLAGTGEVPVSGLGDLQQNTLPGTGWNNTKTQAYSANMSFKVGSVDVVSISGYSKAARADNFDYSPFFADATVPDGSTTNRFSQEIRLSSTIGTRFEWLAGGLYDHQRSTFAQQIVLVDGETGAATGQPLFSDAYQLGYREWAGFADLTTHVTDQFDIQLGARESSIQQSVNETSDGVVVPESTSKANAFTYLVTPRYKLANGLMMYARFASGYRPGGPNHNVGIVAGIPEEFTPDKTTNYELGVKGDALDHTLSFDASVYYIDWKDIQLTVTKDGFSFYTNGSRAKSQGIELSTQYHPLSGLTIAAWGAFNDAKLTDDLPAGSSAYGASGDRLPFSSRFSGNITIDQRFHYAQQWVGFAGGGVSYVGQRDGAFADSPQSPRSNLPGYARIDLRSGVQYGLWKLTLYVNNIADRRGELANGITTDTVFYIQPRTIGLNVSNVFQDD
jgi:iron complex outermembrane receptor protein